MPRIVSILLVVLIVAAAISTAAAEDVKIKALLVTGDDVSAHNWKEIAAATREALESTGRFAVRASEDPLILESKSALDTYDVIVFTLYNRSLPTITPQAQESLLNFIKGGKGFYVQHLASASFKEWEEFGKLCGRHWVMGKSGHGPRSVFQSKVVDREHPITKGIENFEIDDELYAKLQGDEEIHVLVEADSDWSKRTEPLVFTRSYGQGRVVHNAFGHDAKAILNPAVRQITARSVEWAATGKVAE
ncbi:MAG: ThuA domain-containing protein [Pirellulales bacterium]|nr:ThuA domain-containing protein [Pirellulales bacterium]